MNESQARATERGQDAYRAQLNIDLAWVKLAEGYCAAGKAYEGAGAQALASDLQSIQAGRGIVAVAPMTGPAAPYVAGIGLAVIAYGALGLAYHGLSVFANNVQGAPESWRQFGSAYDNLMTPPSSSDPNTEYGLSKGTDAIRERFTKGRADFGFPGLNECKLFEKTLHDTRENIEKQIRGPEDDSNVPSIKEPTPLPPQKTVPMKTKSQNDEPPDGGPEHGNGGEGAYAGPDEPSTGNIA